MTVVAIDGPSGSGKSTVARAVGDELGLAVLDTGAMYRAVTLAVLEAGIDPADAVAVAGLARLVDIQMGAVVLLDGRDVSASIRGPAVTAVVSIVSAHGQVRTELVARQRRWVDDHGGGVVEGRDIGTVVFPDAVVKAYLDASDAERARRRHRDEEVTQRPVAVEDLRAEMARRDRLDSSRAASPLRAAADAMIIDTTERPVTDITDQIVRRYRSSTKGLS